MDTEDRDHFKTIASALPALQRGLQKKQSAASSDSGRVPEASCLRAAEMLLSLYRRDDTHNPEMYAAGLAAVLGEYPKDVIEYVTDPRTGIAAVKTFLPSVAEVREALDARMSQTERQRTYDQRVDEQLRLRDEWKSEQAPERLKAAGRAWLDRSDPKARELSGDKPKAPLSDEQRAALLEDARQVGASLAGMTLRPETLALMREQDQLREMSTRTIDADEKT